MVDAVREYLDSPKDAGTPLTDSISRKPKNMNASTDPGFNPNIPVDVMPGILGDDNGTIAWRKGHDALAAMYEVHQKIIQSALTVSAKNELAKIVEPAALKAMKAMRDQLDGLDSQIRYAESEIKTALGSGTGQIPAEMRGVLRSLPEQERLPFCRALLASGDVESLKAIVSVSRHLSGLDAEAYQYLKEETERLVAPDRVAERETGHSVRARMARALEHFDETMSGNIRRWRASDDQKLADLTAALNPRKNDV